MKLKTKTSLKKMSEVLAHKDYNKVSTIIGFMEEHGEILLKKQKRLRASLLRQCEDILKCSQVQDI